MPGIDSTKPVNTSTAPSLPADLEQPKQDVKQGTSKTTEAAQNVKADTAPSAKKTQQKAKETVGAAADLVDTGVDSIQENAGEAKEGVKQAAGGLWSGIKKPFAWAGHKISNVAANAGTARPNEAVGPLLGAALLVGGTALYIASQMGSWGVTLCVSLPALAAGAAVLGLLSLAITYGRRIVQGAPKPNDNGVDPNSRSHRVGVEANRNFDAAQKADQKELDKLKKLREKLSNNADKNADKLSKLDTQIAMKEKSIEIIGNYPVVPAAPKLVEQAEVKAQVVTTIKAPVVEKVTTTDETVAGDQTKDVPGVTSENKASEESKKAA